MDEAEKRTTQANIREVLVDLLPFYASADEQRLFASKVHYDIYQDEFYFWWFDTFLPEEAQWHAEMFTPAQVTALNEFTRIYGREDAILTGKDMTIDQLIASPEWQRVIAAAQKASLAFDELKNGA